MRRPTLLLLAALSAAVRSDSLPDSLWSVGAECLVRSGAAAHWNVDHPVLDSTRVEAALSVLAASPFADFGVTATLSSPADGVRRADLTRARAMLRWPGTPWVGGGVFLGEGAPFTAGLRRPLVEHGWIRPDSLRGMTLSAGGFLGFRGSYAVALSETDTLVSSRVLSPWMGFAGVEYSRTALRGDSSGVAGGEVLNVLTIRGDLNLVEPWVLLAGAEGEPGCWAVEAELRGFRPLDTGWGRIEIVPGMSFAGDSFHSPGTAFTPGRRVLTLETLLRPDRVMAGAGLLVSADLEGDSLTFVSLGGHMLSEAGISSSLRGLLREDGGYVAGGELGTAAGPGTSAFLGAVVADDSVRVTGRAFFSPRPDVSGGLTVSGNASGPMDPFCALDVSARIGPALGHLGIAWDGGDVLLTAEIGGLFR